MFPNPQDALPLGPQPNLEYYRKLAKELVKASKAGSLEPTHPIREFAIRKFSEKCTLSAAQFVIARSYGFASWAKFVQHLKELARNSPVSRFEAAAEAIVEGDAATLERLLREEPGLIHARSTREHRATLLHYVAANGVESYRQKTPQNIVAITEILLNAGAEIDATADVYGGGCTTLGLAATSVHPERAGVQPELLQILLDHGANVELESAGNRHSLLIACLANGRPKAAEYLAARGARLDMVSAAGIGRLDALMEMIEEATIGQINEALLYASRYGHDEVIEFLLTRGADLATHRRDGQSPLHMAVIGGHPNTVKLLLRHKPPLEMKNVHGGTVFGQALWSAAHGGDPQRYIAIMEALAEAGAKICDKHPPINPEVDAWLAAHGSFADPSRYWSGEKPPAD